MTQLNNFNKDMDGFWEIFKYDGLKNIRTVVEQVDAGQIADQLRSVNKVLGQNKGGRDRAERELCGKKLRAVVEDRVVIWFVAKDAAEVLEFRDASRAVRYHVAKDRPVEITGRGFQGKTADDHCAEPAGDHRPDSWQQDNRGEAVPQLGDRYGDTVYFKIWSLYGAGHLKGDTREP